MPTTANTSIPPATNTCLLPYTTHFRSMFDSTNCTGKGMILRTWTATDGCGNSASCLHLKRTRETVRQIITSYADITLECTVLPTTDNTGKASVTDTCSGVSSINCVDAS